MKKIIASEFQQNEPDKIEIFVNWSAVNESVNKFQNQCSQSTLKYLYGDTEGERLWVLFVGRCNRKFDEFIKCLVIKQSNDLLVNIHYNKTLYFN